MRANLKVGFVGLTHLGLTYLAASSEKGFKVIGIDLNQNKINKLKKFDIEYEEPNLRKTILLFVLIILAYSCADYRANETIQKKENI